MGTPVGFSSFIVEIEDPATPGTFLAACGITSKALNRSASAVETPDVDCDDEDLPAVILRGIASTDWNIAGAVTMHGEDMDLWDDWFEGINGDTRNVRIAVDLPKAKGGRSYKGPAVLTGYNVKVDKGGKAATGDMTITGAGKLVRTAAAA